MTRLRLAGALPIILVLAAACSSGGGATPSPSTAASIQPPGTGASPSAAGSPSDAASPSATAEDEYELKVAAGSGSVTNFLTGEDGRTLYIFKKDTADSGKSVCNGECATNWPPLEVDELDEVKPDSGATGKLSLITRDDGTTQLAYNGLPLYYFAGDAAPGDTNGASIPNWAVATP
jgi:predicted lipoprotein with Yx(FWY)xxD motif